MSQDMQAVIDTAIESTEPDVLTAGEVISVVVPEGASQVITDLEQFLPAPRRPRGIASFRDEASFSQYVNRQGGDPGPGTALYADVDAHSIVAVLNDDYGPDGGWRDRRAELHLRLSPEWQAWTRHDNTAMGQLAFAELIEDQLIDIVEPDGADLLELAQTLQVNTAVNFRSSRMLHNGQTQITYEEQTDARAGSAGQLEVPKEFQLGIPVYDGEEPVRITARFRYRVREGKLAISYKLVNKQDVVRDAFAAVVAVAREATGCVTFNGTPPPELRPILGYSHRAAQAF